MKICLLGAAGGIGQALALLLKVNLAQYTKDKPIELSLYDLNPATPGVGVDLSHIPNKIKVIAYVGEENLHQAIAGSDIVAISAGVARKPGMDRSDLFNINASITQKLIKAVGAAAPDAFIALITNPLNTTLAIAKAQLRKDGVYNAKKLFGITNLDVIRAKQFVAELEPSYTDPSQVKVDVIGGHSGTTILPLLDRVIIGKSEEFYKKLTHRIQNAGTEVVEAKAGAGSATLSMAYAAYEIIEHLLRAKQGDTVEFAALVDIPNSPVELFAQQVRVNQDGIVQSCQAYHLSGLEIAFLDELAEILKKDIRLGKEFVDNNPL